MLVAVLPGEAACRRYARPLVARTSDNEGPNILDTLKIVAIYFMGKRRTSFTATATKSKKLINRADAIA